MITTDIKTGWAESMDQCILDLAAMGADIRWGDSAWSCLNADRQPIDHPQLAPIQTVDNYKFMDLEMDTLDALETFWELADRQQRGAEQADSCEDSYDDPYEHPFYVDWEEDVEEDAANQKDQDSLLWGCIERYKTKREEDI